MIYSYIVGSTGIVIGIVSFFCFLNQRYQRKKLQSFIRSQAWYLYKKANRLLITIRNADKLYTSNGTSPLEVEIVKQLAKSEAFGIEILDETLRHIHLFEPNLNSKKIKEWENENKLLNDDKHLFEIKENEFLLEKFAAQKYEGNLQSVSTINSDE